MDRPRRIGGDGVGGGLVAAAGAGLFAWTYVTDLPFEAALIPRIAFGAMIFGGVWIFARDALGRNRVGDHHSEETSSWSEAIVAAVALPAMLLAGWLVLRIGLASTGFISLSTTWLLLRWRFAPDVPYYLRSWRAFALAAAISATMYVVFILLLGIHLPRTILF